MSNSRRRHRAFRATLAACALIAATASLPARAALGELLESAQTDAVGLQGRAATMQRAAYNVSSITLPTGTVVNEYAAPGGKVFAVAWRGPVPPDLSQLLGSYYTDFQSALAARQSAPHDRRLQLDSGRMIYRSGGHMRDFNGNAYVPALMPQGLSLGDLR